MVSGLRLVPGDPTDDGATAGPFAKTEPLPWRLPPGRHGIPATVVAEHQRLRLIAGMAEALADHGYANITTTHVSERANVSTSTFYKHFGNLWDCLLAAYVAGADRLCEEIEAACAAGDDDAEPLEAGIGAALTLFAAEPQLGRLLCAQAPREASALCAARRLLVSRLAAMLRRARGTEGEPPHPRGLDERLIDATLAFMHTRLAGNEAAALPELGPELVAILDRPRVTA
jgi:AcrR family transcriptional regulator